VSLVACTAVVVACSNKTVTKMTAFSGQAVSASPAGVQRVSNDGGWRHPGGEFIEGTCTNCHDKLERSMCPADMVEIDGTYCPNDQEVCLRWVDAQGNTVDPPKSLEKYPTGRCGEFQYPTKCLTPEAKRPHKHYCVDKYEYPNVEGQRPQSWMTWYDVKHACEAQGKRLCTKEEWTFACEGPDMQPYPYAGHGEHPGYSRDESACNIDNPFPEDPEKPINPQTGKRYEISVFDSKRPHDRVTTILDNLLTPAGSKPECASPWGVYDMVGNIDEFINNTAIPEHSPRAPFRSGLMSGHVFGVRNQCRAMTDGHYEYFGWYETGGRCCGDPQENK